MTHTYLTREDGLRVMSMLAILLSIPCIRLINPLIVPWFVLVWFATLIGRNKLLLMLGSLKSHQKYSAWCSSCWQLPLNLRLLELWTFGSNVTSDAAVMTSRQAFFGWMLLNILYRIMISILTNNIALTFYMSPMRRDIFWWGRIFNFTFP